jgi:hypothetical protein
LERSIRAGTLVVRRRTTRERVQACESREPEDARTAEEPSRTMLFDSLAQAEEGFFYR